MRIVIVDKDDNFLKLVEDADHTPADIYRCSGLWLTNSQGQILLAQRKLTKKHDPGKWGPAVSGTIESGETYETNIYKEAQEEIGLSGHNFIMGPKVYNDYGKYRFFVQWFTCETKWLLEKFVLQDNEVAKVTWIDKDQLIDELNSSPDKYVAGAAQVFAPFLT